MNLRYLCLIALLPVSIFLGCGGNADSGDGQDELVRPVIYHPIEATAGQLRRSFPARVTAANLRELNFPVPGVVLVVPVEESQKVRAGQVLVQLDERDYESALSAARARAENARQELERAERLHKEDAIARSVLEQRQAVAEVTAAEVSAAEKALADTRIVAPFDGVISRIFVSEAQTVGAGMPAVRLFSRNDLEARVALPANLVVNVDGAQREQSRILVRLEADPEHPIEAIFKKAELEADVNSQSYAVSFGFQAPDNLNVLPGMNAEVELIINRDASSQAAVEVPLRAIQAQGDERFVWVIDPQTEPDRVVRRRVTVGAAVGEALPVLSGLNPGEVIVAAGVSGLVDGMAVRPWQRSTD